MQRSVMIVARPPRTNIAPVGQLCAHREHPAHFSGSSLTAWNMEADA
jgi:hypothetical protein